MDIAELRALIAGGERFTVEFKRASPKNTLSDRELVEAVMCMANGDGGWLLLGVEDGGEVSGVAPRHDAVTDPDRLAALVLNRTDPPTGVSVEVIEVDGLPVVAIEVPKAASPVGTKDGVFRRRSKKVDGTPECVPYRPHEMISLGFALSERDYAGVPARGASMDDLDPAEFDRYRRLCGRAAGDRSLARADDLEICRALRVLSLDGGIAIGALLLFGRPEALERYVPSAECLFHELDNARITSQETIRGPLLYAAERLYDLLDSRNTEQEVSVGLLRVAVPRVSGPALREVIANALVHRDYAELGPIRVQLNQDELRVTSPGGLPPGVSLRTLIDESRPRSVILADAFKRAGIVDRAGRGVHAMYESMLRSGRSGPDYSLTTDRSVSVVLPTTSSDLGMVRFVAAYEDEHPPLTLNQMRVLFEIRSVGPSSVAELVSSVQITEAAVRTTTARLVEAGLLEVRGNGRNRRYHLTAGFYRSAEDRNSYVRVRAVDPIQQDEMVLSYVAAYGQITRAQAAALCMLSPQQARTVLQRLTDARRLILQGERRGSHYVLPPGD